MCESNIANQQSDVSSGGTKALFLWLGLAVLVLVVVVSWQFMLFQDNSQPTIDHRVDDQPVVENDIAAAVDLIEDQSINQDTSQIFNQHIKILHQVSGLTTNGGRYWLFNIQNTSDAELLRPGIMVSLFDSGGKRLAEQAGYAYRKRLQPGATTPVLVFLDQPPTNSAANEITTMAYQFSRLQVNQAEIQVKDYTVSKKYSLYEIIGDVFNDLDSEVKYPEVIAEALDEQGNTIGLGKTFSTLKILPPKTGSGFKLSIGTFLTEEPSSWKVYALARKSPH